MTVTTRPPRLPAFSPQKNKSASNGKPHSPASNTARSVKRKSVGSVKSTPPPPPEPKAAPAAPPNFWHEDTQPLPAMVYEPARNVFYVPTAGGEWIRIPESSVRVRLKRAGFKEFFKDANHVTELEHVKERVMVEKHVAYAGQIAGHAPGFKLICGARFLITRGPALRTAKAGQWPRIEQWLNELFAGDKEHGERQWWTVFGWLAGAWRALHTGIQTAEFGPGQALFLVGAGGTGKSVFQKFITLLLGGRVADPSRYLFGNEFNKDLVGAEHNAIEDTATARDIDSRRGFGQALKNMVVNQTHSLHGKGADALTVTRFCRLTISLNDQPEDLMVLPELSHGVVDKTIIVRCGKAALPDLLDTRAVAAFWDAIRAELPAFLHALETTKLPPLVTGDETARRYGVASWQHPVIVGQVEDLSPWKRTLELIEHARPWAEGLEAGDVVRDCWEGTAQDLEALLLARCRERAQRVLRGPASTGRDLRAMAERLPARFNRYESHGAVKWRIFAPKS